MVGDVHDDLRHLDWVPSQARDFELVVLVGDLLDISSAVPLEAQIPVVIRYLERLAERTATAVCSGNHDLTGRDADGEQAAGWLAKAAELGVVVDDGSVVVGDAQVDVHGWWDGPIGRERLEARLEALAEARGAADAPRRWVWVYHRPPPDVPVSGVGTKFYGDADLAGWIERFGPDLVLTGHVHQSPWVDGGSLVSSLGSTWIVNAGHETGPEPSHAVIDLLGWTASWRSFGRSEEQSLESVEPVAQ